MEDGLERLIESESHETTIFRGRRRSDDVASLPGHDSYKFVEDYLAQNPEASTAILPTEQLKGILEYVTSLQNHSRREHHNARHDTLTQIPNRFGLEEELNFMTREADESNTNLTYIFFDIDNFKRINTEYTHEGGDQILRALGKSISEVTRPQDYAGRVGGEEFVLVLKDTSLDEGLKVAKRLKGSIQGKMNEYFERGEIPSTITLSMGISNYTGNASNVHELTQKAKDALMHAKGIEGKDRIVYHNPEGSLTEYHS